MGYVIALLVIFAFVVSAKNKKAKRRVAQPKGRTDGGAPEVVAESEEPGAESRSAKAAPVEKAAEPADERAQSAAPVAAAAATTVEKYEGEGEAPGEHAEHLAAMRAADRARREASRSTRESRSLRRESLRAAIVMREVLDKPVSLRPPRS